VINDRDIAAAISDLMLELGRKLNDSLRVVQERCTEEETRAYREAISRILLDQLIEIMNPIYRAHPDLKPANLGPTPAASCTPKAGRGLSEVNERIKKALAAAASDVQGALAILDEGIEEARATGDSRGIVALARQAGILATGRDLPAALRYYEEALAVDPDDSRLRWALGDVHRVLGNLDEARAAFTRSLERAKERRDVEMVEFAARALGQVDPQDAD
jgi:tetratricopeptide (TPR) repeat protein